ncbi:MAG: hypothetical protein A3F41_02585 [Coxiella sp. RIFCSPHIGHO2_12_FULL_44_14]|nr:MAG: hypothetical protein A3F41_02585 [Coxiella sp. RIFCSPHIGHO2_12_FULL_44_14]
MKKRVLWIITIGLVLIMGIVLSQATTSGVVCVQNQSKAVIWVTIPPHPRTLLTNLAAPYVASVTPGSNKNTVNVFCCLDSTQQSCLSDIYCYTPLFIHTVTLRPGQMLYVQPLPPAKPGKYLQYRIVDDGCSTIQSR